MDEQAYQHWQVLHRRVIMGEALSGAEQAAYEAGCQELDAEERLDGGLSAYGNCARRLPRQKRSNNACEHKRRNSTLVLPPSKPAWTHGRANSSVLATELHGASKTADGSGTLRLLLWILWSFRDGCWRGVDGGPFPPDISGRRRQRCESRVCVCAM